MNRQTSTSGLLVSDEHKEGSLCTRCSRKLMNVVETPDSLDNAESGEEDAPDRDDDPVRSRQVARGYRADAHNDAGVEGEEIRSQQPPPERVSVERLLRSGDETARNSDDVTETASGAKRTNQQLTDALIP